MADQATISIQNLTKRFGSVTAVDNLSFEVNPGAVTGFLGPNGAGKTTTLRVLLGLAAPTSGRAVIGGRAYTDLDDPPCTVGALLDASGLHPGRSGRDHLRVLAAAAGIPHRRVAEVLDLVDLTAVAKRRCRGYSLGMRQRLGLAAALLGDPQVLILDEPANGLDPEGVAWLRRFLRSLAETGRTVLVSSHLLAEMAQLADNVVIIARGHLVATAPIEELLTRGSQQVRVRSPEAGKVGEALLRQGKQYEKDGPDRLVVQGATMEEVGRIAFDAGAPVYELSAAAPSLEDVFLELTGEPRW